MVDTALALSSSPEAFHEFDPVTVPIAIYGHQSDQHCLSKEKAFAGWRVITSAAPLMYCAWPPTRLDWLFLPLSSLFGLEDILGCSQCLLELRLGKRKEVSKGRLPGHNAGSAFC
jgi:hypothetical protein